MKVMNMMLIQKLVCPLLFLWPSIYALNLKQTSLEGTETTADLTDKQLGIQRWFAGLTYLKKDLSDWSGWGDSIHDVDCDGNTCIRYEIAGLAYAAALLGLKTPAYKQVAEAIMFNAITRMTQQPVWQYIELFDDFKSQPTYPDPVAYKNIMYSGHLVQMVTMFQTIFLNDTFSTDGWDFHWTDPATGTSTTMHYNTSLLLERVYRQSLAYGIGGVPCEPDSIFLICNNYPQNGWMLYDQLYQSNYTAQTIPTWHKTLKLHAINRPDEAAIGNYFKLDYLIRPLGIWEPIGTIGSDMWALAWIKPWWPAADIDPSLVSGFNSVVNSSSWVRLTHDSSSDTPDLLPQAHLHPDDRHQKLFPFDDVITTSFYPMIEKQFLSSSESSSLDLYQSVLRYFEANYGNAADLDGDNVIESYRYNAIGSSKKSDDQEEDDDEVGDYSIWATANLLIGMILPNDDVDYLRSFFQRGGGDVILEQKKKALRLESVDYPHVMVASALSTAHDLSMTLKPGDNAPLLPSSHTVTVSNIAKEAADHLVVKVNDTLFKRYDVISDESSPDRVKLVLRLSGWTEEGLVQSQPIRIQIIC